MIVVAIIALIAAVAVPNLISAKRSSNEAAAISALRNLASVQVQIANRKFIDVDGDGRGEFGFFGELSGAVPPRNVAGNSLLPPLLAGSFQSVNAGFITRQGYTFAIFLPDVNGAGLLETAANYATVDADLAEDVWCAYAWPSDGGNSGRNAFFINQVGEILRTDNTVQGYAGMALPPAADSVFVQAGSIASAYDAGQVAQDGGIWRVLD